MKLTKFLTIQAALFAFLIPSFYAMEQEECDLDQTFQSDLLNEPISLRDEATEEDESTCEEPTGEPMEIDSAAVGVDQNALRNTPMYAMAAEQYALGEALYLGTDCLVDFDRAYTSFEFASNQLDNKQVRAKALFYLGLLNLIGYIKKSIGLDLKNNNIYLAHTYFDLAIQQSDSKQAQAGGWLGLGIIYAYGLGVKKDYQIGHKCFYIAANQKYTRRLQTASQIQLAHIYFYGKGVDRDFNVARSYYDLAANQTLDRGLQAAGQNGLGLIYLNRKDYDSAEKKF